MNERTLLNNVISMEQREGQSDFMEWDPPPRLAEWNLEDSRGTETLDCVLIILQQFRARMAALLRL